MSGVRPLLRRAEQALGEAGVASPAYDAAELLAHVLGVPRGRLVLVDEVSPEQERAFAAMVERRSARVPLQHLTGRAGFRRVELAVGPGVFVPRPETELLAGWAVEQAGALPAPVVVDLCTGSGAIARSLADEAPHAEVYAVELSAEAHAWAERNLTGTGVDLRLGDMAQALPELDGRVDVVVSNPPYVPWEAWESVAVEARDHDPEVALFSGDDGLDALRVLDRVAGRLLRPGGVLGVEHADVQGESAPGVLAASGRWREIADHRDLAGRPRYLTARLAR